MNLDHLCRIMGGLEYIIIEGTPHEEPCTQVNPDVYNQPDMKKECRAFRNQLFRAFPIPENLKGNVDIVMNTNHHEFGTYYDLAILYREDNDDAVDWAMEVESHTIEHWDKEAIEELKLVGYAFPQTLSVIHKISKDETCKVA